MSGPYYAGVDLGGTKIMAIVADGEGKIVGDQRLPTQASKGAEHVIDRMVEATRAAADEAGIALADVSAAGVSAPGPIDWQHGVVTDPPNLPGWHDVPLTRLFSERSGLSSVLENDANCGAVGEHQFGAGRGYRHLIYVTISTGLGGGLIIDNELYRGASGAAGELGHIIVADDGAMCGAKHVGCMEAYASGAGIAQRAQELIDAGSMPRTARIAEQKPPLSAESVHLAAQAGETEAQAIIDRAARYFGMGLATMINAFNPEIIVIGGGLTHIGDEYLAPALEVARARSFEQPFQDVRIVEWELGERGTALGALALARSRDRKDTN
ncbi:MAG: ROK family protein [Dehalococcoidia bacterium]